MLRKLTITLSAVALSGIGIAAVSAAGSSAAPQAPAAIQTSSVLYSSLVSPYSATNPPTDWWGLSFGGTSATQLGDKINLPSQSRLTSATVIVELAGVSERQRRVVPNDLRGNVLSADHVYDL